MTPDKLTENQEQKSNIDQPVVSSSASIAANVSGLCEGRASDYKSFSLAQCLIEVQMFNKPLMPCFCKTLVMGSCFSGVQNLVK